MSGRYRQIASAAGGAVFLVTVTILGPAALLLQLAAGVAGKA